MGIREKLIEGWTLGLLLYYPDRRDQEDGMAMALHEVLERRFGVDEDEFAAALVEFADRAGPLALVDIRPDEYFGDRQRATLRKLGASLQPLRPDEVGPIAGLAAAYAEVVSKSLSVAVVAGRLDVDTSRVRQRIYARSLFAFKHRGAWLVPAFQLKGRKLVPGVELVVAALSPTLHPVAVTRWFTTPNADLVLGGEPVSPIAWLSSGGPCEAVAEQAAGVDQL
jgi:hypothetical protein